MDQKESLLMFFRLLFFLMMLSCFFSPAKAMDLSSLREVFEYPLGTDPVMEEIVLNGSPQLRLTFKTRIPFSELGTYYSLLLKSKAWSRFPLENLFMNPFMIGKTEQMLFIRGREILLFSLVDTESENWLMITFMEGFPLLAPQREDISKWQVDGISFPDALPVLQFEIKQSGNPEKSGLIAYSTNSSPDFILDYFEREILGKGWKTSEMFSLFGEELARFNIPGIDSAFKKVRFYRKQDRTLFFYASQNTSGPGSLFGYYYKS